MISFHFPPQPRKFNEITTAAQWNPKPPREVSKDAERVKQWADKSTDASTERAEVCVSSLRTNTGSNEADKTKMGPSDSQWGHCQQRQGRGAGTNRTHKFHKQPVIRHSAGQVWLGHPAHTLSRGWGRGHLTEAHWERYDKARSEVRRACQGLVNWHLSIADLWHLRSII